MLAYDRHTLGKRAYPFRKDGLIHLFPIKPNTIPGNKLLSSLIKFT